MNLQYQTTNVASGILVLITFFVFTAFSSCNKGSEGEVAVDDKSPHSYYIDAVNGDDSNNGMSENEAWQTFSNVNGVVFNPGDKILLKTGCSWDGQLKPKGSGTEDMPISIASYGTGDKPVLNGLGLEGAVVYLINQSNWIIRDLEITNTSSERSYIYRWGINVENKGGGTIRNIQILNNWVHHVTGSFYWPQTPNGYAGPHCNGGIALNVTGTTGNDKFSDVLIQDNTVSYSGRTGIVVWDNVWNGSEFASTNVIIRKNFVEFIDSDGILTYGCNGALIEYNKANTCGNYAEEGQFNGSCAIWPTRGADCIVQYNEAFNTRAQLDNIDGQGFDVDIDATDCIIQYNYSHDNEGGFLLIVDAEGSPGVEIGTSGTIVRYNISQNDKTRIINIAGGIAANTNIYNNTFYVGSGLNTNIIEHSWDIDMTRSLFFSNNIIYNLGTGEYKIPGTLGENTLFSHNLYFGNHPSNEPEDEQKLTSDPLLVAPGSGGTGLESLDGYRLGSGSPAIGTGKIIDDIQKVDFWRNTIPAGAIPNRGAYGGPGINP